MTRLVLPEDLLVTPVADLPAAQRDALAAQPGDAVLTRPRHRRRGLLVDADTAGLVEAFRVPTTVEEAVLLFALGRGLDPSAVLTEAYPALVHLQQARYLLPAGHAGAGAARALDAGTDVAGWEVVRALQVFDDGDVHEVRRGDVVAVLKRVHAWAPARSRRQLGREREVLTLLAERGAGGEVPSVLDGGESDDGSGLLVVSWLPGVDVGTAAGRLRHRHGPASSPALRLCAAIARAYARLHRLGVLHGDVHPANLLADDLDSPAGPHVRLIDFGLAGAADGSGPGRAPVRGGIGWAFEPELAQAALAGRGDPPLTGAGELYSLAAVCFHLLTGTHHVDVPARREDVFDRVLHQVPRTLSAAAGRAEGAFPFTDAAFAAALDADPHRRVGGDPDGAVPEAFVQLADALDAEAAAAERTSGPSGATGATGSSTPAPGFDAGAARRTVPPAPGSLLHRLLTGPADLPAPHASLTHGAAGIATALLDLALATADADADLAGRALAAADAWARHADHRASGPLADTGDGDPAFCSPQVGISPALVGTASLMHGPAGVHLAHAQTALAVGDLTRARSSVDAWLSEAGPAPAPRAGDLVFGSAGLVLGGTGLHAALAVDDAHGPLAGVRARVRAWLTEATSRLLAEAPATGWGMAHGRAGVLLAASLAVTELGDADPDTLDRLRLLRAHVLDVVAGAPASWCAVPGLEASWCNGLAGALLALDAAARAVEDDGCLPVRDDLAGALAVARWRNASLCCGATGGAHALAVHAATTGRSAWWEAAARVADDAVGLARPGDARAHSYVKGALGPLVLQAQVRAAGHVPGAWHVPFHPARPPRRPHQEQR